MLYLWYSAKITPKIISAANNFTNYNQLLILIPLYTHTHKKYIYIYYLALYNLEKSILHMLLLSQHN